MTDYKEKVRQKLESMFVGDELVIEDLVAPENRDRFIQAVKQFIDENIEVGGKVEFSSDYKKIRRIGNFCDLIKHHERSTEAQA